MKQPIPFLQFLFWVQRNKKMVSEQAQIFNTKENKICAKNRTF